jgi:hypothetical protein
MVTKLSKIWDWDPGSRKNLVQIQYPGVKKAPDPLSGSATQFTTQNSLVNVSNNFDENIAKLQFDG